MNYCQITGGSMQEWQSSWWDRGKEFIEKRSSKTEQIGRSSVDAIRNRQLTRREK